MKMYFVMSETGREFSSPKAWPFNSFPKIYPKLFSYPTGTQTSKLTQEQCTLLQCISIHILTKNAHTTARARVVQLDTLSQGLEPLFTLATLAPTDYIQTLHITPFHREYLR